MGKKRHGASKPTRLLTDEHDKSLKTGSARSGNRKSGAIIICRRPLFQRFRSCLTAVTHRRLGRMARGALFPGLSAIFCKKPSYRIPNPNDKQTPILQKFPNPHTPRRPKVRPTTTPPPRRSDPLAVNRDTKGKKRSANSRFCRCFSATYQSTPSTQSTRRLLKK